ncbi:MAG: hypothetical protein HOP13_07470 [Alphaproteobacteria bacterium]|nr:hypothetical protein [Alphaproteobacteria bacterium]
MSISDLRPLFDGFRHGARLRAGSDESVVVDAMARLIDRFVDGESGELVKALDGLKPKRKKGSAAAKASAPPSDLVTTYIAQLRSAFGDIAAASEVMKRMRGDKAVKKAEAVAIAQGVGVRATSKTPKAQALTQIEGLYYQAERDRLAAERIRRGA